MRLLGVDLAWRDATPERAANATGVCALDADGRVLDAGWTFGVDATAAWMRRMAGRGPALAFVDAPLLVENPTGMRECERQIMRRFGRYKLGANAANLGMAHLAGQSLRRSLAQSGWRYDDGLDGPPVTGRRLSECYPYATLVAAAEFGLPPKRPAYKRRPREVSTAEWPQRRAAMLDAIVRSLAAAGAVSGPGAVPLDLASHPVTAEVASTCAPVGASAYKRREDLVDAVLCAWTAMLWWRHGWGRCEVLGVPEGGLGGGVGDAQSETAEGGGFTTQRPVASVIVPVRPPD